MSFYKDVITQEMQAFLMSKDIEVSVEDVSTNETMPADMLKFAVLVGNGKLGGLHFSATINKFDLSESLQVCQKVLHAQLLLYAIECIKAGHKAEVPSPFVPEITETVTHQTVDNARNHFNGIATVVEQFDVFKSSVFNKKNKIKKAKTCNPTQ